MNDTAIVYLLEDEEDGQHLLWKAFQKTQPDCLLYCFSSAHEMLEHLLEDFTKPALLMISMACRKSASTVMQYLSDGLREQEIATVVVLQDNPLGYEGPAVGAIYSKPKNFTRAVKLLQHVRETMLKTEPEGQRRR